MLGCPAECGEKFNNMDTLREHLTSKCQQVSSSKEHKTVENPKFKLVGYVEKKSDNPASILVEHKEGHDCSGLYFHKPEPFNADIY
jgi:hypothetical protein